MADGRGGARQGAGRPAGALNKDTAEKRKAIAELAKEHTRAALDALVDVMEHGQSESARVSASNAILDRAYGKPMQSMDVSNTDGTMRTVDVSRLSLAERKALLSAVIIGEDEVPANEG